MGMTISGGYPLNLGTELSPKVRTLLRHMGMKRTLAFAITVLVAACGGDAGGATTTSIPPASTSTSR